MGPNQRGSFLGMASASLRLSLVQRLLFCFVVFLLNLTICLLDLLLLVRFFCLTGGCLFLFHVVISCTFLPSSAFFFF